MLWIGKDIYQTSPPMPEQVVTQSGQGVYTRDDIEVGRSVWQSIGGQQNGSIWGDGALIAPDWSAEWLHLEVMAMLERRARSEFGLAYDALEDSEQVKLQAEIRPESRLRSEEHTSGLQSLMPTSSADVRLNKTNTPRTA